MAGRLSNNEAEHSPLLPRVLLVEGINNADDAQQPQQRRRPASAPQRVVCLDAFRGITIALMILVDDAGNAYPSIDHSPWDGMTLADLAEPFFNFIVGVAIAIVFKRVGEPNGPSRWEATQRCVTRTFKLFIIGVLTQGGVTLVSFDMSTIRYMGILQRVAICYLVGCLVALFVPAMRVQRTGLWWVHKAYVYQWVVAALIAGVYLAVMFGTYVPTHGCGRGKLDPGCNAQTYVDSVILTPAHMYDGPTYIRLPECSTCPPGLGLNHECRKPPADAAWWCYQRFDPEGFVSSISASLSAVLGLQYGHFIAQLGTSAHRDRVLNWSFLNVVCGVVGLVLHYSGFQPLNLNLYSISTVLVEGSIAGILLTALYFIQDFPLELSGPAGRLPIICRKMLLPFVWAGMNAILLYLLAAGDVFESIIGFFYWETPGNDLNALIKDKLFRSWLPADLAVLLWTFCKIVFWFAVAAELHRRKLYWKI